jgi:hypothetical protein
MKKYADTLWNWFIEEKYENVDGLKGYDLEMDKLDRCKTFLENSDLDDIAELSGLTCDIKDWNDFAKAADRLVVVMLKGIELAENGLMKQQFGHWGF